MHFDPVRSTIAVSKADGSLVRERYNAYGSPMQTAASGTENVAFTNLTDVRFAGHVTDDETGLVYMGARYYAPTLGRFITMDPAPYSTANVQSFNRYAYANNNPNKFIDPDGKVPVLAVPLLGAGAKIADTIITGIEAYSAYQTGGASAAAAYAATELTGNAIANKILPGGKTVETFMSNESREQLISFFKSQKNGCVALACARAGDFDRANKAHNINEAGGFQGVDLKSVFPDAKYRIKDTTDDISYLLKPGDFVQFNGKRGGGGAHIDYFSGKDPKLSEYDLSLHQTFYLRTSIFTLPSK